MNYNALLVGTLILAAAAAQGEDVFNPNNLPPGSIVRVVAKRPPINLRRADVVGCTSNLLTLRHKTDRFDVSPSNIIELTLLEKGVVVPPPDATGQTAQADSQPDAKEPADRLQGVKALWARIKNLWK
jgi:hypothetical protein